MEVRMEYTEGRGRKAEVWVDGNLLLVCDGFSPADDPCPPGVMKGVKFTYMSAEGFTWDRATGENRARKRRLEPLDGWSYAGYGQIVSVAPVVIDFGLLQMEDANWTTDEGLVGSYVRIPIDRLEIIVADEPDFPEDIA